MTIRDVAAAAGVSPTTVSHALNGKGQVDPLTRERVHAVAADLGYRASRAAQALRSGRSGIIAMLLPDLTQHDDGQPALSLEYYMRVAAAAAGVAVARSHPLLLAPAPDSVQAVHGLGVDGAIVVDPDRDDPRVGMLLDAGLPVVSIERDLGRPDHRSFVHGDNHTATLALLDHLRDAGAERIAMLATDAPWAWAVESEDAYRAWCAERDLPAVVRHTALHAIQGHAHELTLDLLGGPDPPDAIFAQPEASASAVLRAARERGLHVPDDLLVAGGIDSSDLRSGEPAITTIDLLPDQQGAAVAELLIAVLEGEPASDPVLVPATLRLRASTLRER